MFLQSKPFSADILLFWKERSCVGFIVTVGLRVMYVFE